MNIIVNRLKQLTDGYVETSKNLIEYQDNIKYCIEILNTLVPITHEVYYNESDMLRSDDQFNWLIKELEILIDIIDKFIISKNNKAYTKILNVVIDLLRDAINNLEDEKRRLILYYSDNPHLHLYKKPLSNDKLLK